MRGIFAVCLIVFLILLSACRRDIPEPESRAMSDPIQFFSTDAVQLVSNPPVTEQTDFFVQHHIKGNNLFIECIVNDISFRSSNDSNKSKGKIRLSVDGKKTMEISSAAFIVKGLASGTHLVKLEILKPEDKAFSLEKEFYITIP